LHDVALLTSNYHVYPDFHGNRSPLADSEMCGAICGLSLDKSVNNLAVAYLAAVQALAYGIRHILDEMEK
jgi:ribulose kinase